MVDNFEDGGSCWRIAGEGGLLLVVVHSCIGSVPLVPDSSVKVRPLVQFVILPLRVFVLGLLEGFAVCPPFGHRAGLTDIRATSLR